jgi:hypothetical protein
MSYTIGNWTVEPLTTDSISTAKALSLVDLSYAADYTVTERGTAEVRLANTTGAGLAPVEQLRYGRTRVKDVYASNGLDVPASQKCNVRDGIRTLHECKYLLKATNSVSGEELLLPMRGWICLEAPTVDFISSAALFDLFKRTVGAALATGKTDGTLVTDVARGDLDPTS